MLDFTPINMRTWAKLGQRGAFGAAMLELAHTVDDLIVLTADLGNTSGLDRMREAFPEKFYNVGIAENNMINLAAGLAKEGNNVFCTTFANFAVMRSYEQIRLSLGYMMFPVKVVGIGSGFAMGFFGNTHYGMEDIALMRAIPNLTVISPADCSEVVKATVACAEYNKPVYLRLTGVMNNPMVYKENYNFEIGKAIKLKDGKDIAIIATGSMVYNSLKAAEILESKGYSCSVINIHTIKPLDENSIKNCLDKKLIVTVEEHSVIGGLGSAVSDIVSKKSRNCILLKIGIKDFFQKAGDYQYLLKVNGLDEISISNIIEEGIRKL